jgi:putative ABC transport system ATP-binding protein
MTAVAAREYAMLDRAGRIQFPRDMIERLGMRDRVQLQEEADHIGVWPDDDAGPQAERGR